MPIFSRIIRTACFFSFFLKISSLTALFLKNTQKQKLESWQVSFIVSRTHCGFERFSRMVARFGLVALRWPTPDQNSENMVGLQEYKECIYRV